MWRCKFHDFAFRQYRTAPRFTSSSRRHSHDHRTARTASLHAAWPTAYLSSTRTSTAHVLVAPHSKGARKQSGGGTDDWLISRQVIEFLLQSECPFDGHSSLVLLKQDCICVGIATAKECKYCPCSGFYMGTPKRERPVTVPFCPPKFPLT